MKDYYNIRTSSQAYTGWNKKGYNGHHNVKDMITVIHIAVDF